MPVRGSGCFLGPIIRKKYDTNMTKAQTLFFALSASFLHHRMKLRRFDCQITAGCLQWGKPNQANSLFFQYCFAFLSVFGRFRE
jgi:hypothetical protein